MTRIAYFIPEFPGNTHVFFWRERRVLLELGIVPELLSTRPPAPGPAAHAWAKSAAAETTYLVPLRARDIAHVLRTILAAGPRGWARCVLALLRARNMSLRQRLRLAALIPFGARLAALARARGWQHVHVHSCADAANVALFGHLLGGPAYSLTLHGPTLEVYGPNQAQKWRHARFGLAVTEKLRQQLERELGRNLPPSLAVAPMGVDLDLVRRETAYAPWRSGPVRICSVGRLNRVKGHADLLKAVTALRRRGFDVRLMICGEDEQGGSGYRRELARLVQESGLAEFVQLPGALAEADVRDVLERSHLFALASLNEGVSVAVMEAMAMGLPVIVTRVGGMAELIEPEHNGLFVPAQAPQAMAAAIERLLRDPELATRLGRQARETVAGRFSHRCSAELIARFVRG